jgi:two-component system, OmpR family, response regulator
MRILIIEDEPELRRVLVQALREAGYAVDEAADGPDGLFKAIAWTYDLVLLDLMLPGLDGIEVLRRLRREKPTPVLVLTARDTVPDRIRGLDVGADDYVVKPFNLAEVLARVRAIIRRAAGRGESRITIGDVAVDTAKKTVTRAGEAVVLTAREFAILELLVNYRGKVVTKSEIYEHIFDENEDTLSNLVEVHVSNIRKKLGRDFIGTRRGMGYVVNG